MLYLYTHAPRGGISKFCTKLKWFKLQVYNFIQQNTNYYINKILGLNLYPKNDGTNLEEKDIKSEIGKIEGQN